MRPEVPPGDIREFVVRPELAVDFLTKEIALVDPRKIDQAMAKNNTLFVYPMSKGAKEADLAFRATVWVGLVSVEGKSTVADLVAGMHAHLDSLEIDTEDSRGAAFLRSIRRDLPHIISSLLELEDIYPSDVLQDARDDIAILHASVMRSRGEST
jgi:hypothetical protein